MKYYIYAITNEKGKIYVGQTSNLIARLKRHNGELTNNQRAYTKINSGPWRVVYQEQLTSRTEALSRERYLKSHHGRDWLKSQLILGR